MLGSLKPHPGALLPHWTTELPQRAPVWPVLGLCPSTQGQEALTLQQQALGTRDPGTPSPNCPETHSSPPAWIYPPEHDPTAGVSAPGLRHGQRKQFAGDEGGPGGGPGRPLSACHKAGGGEKEELGSEISQLDSSPPRCCEGVFVKAEGQNTFYLTFC